MINLTRGKCDHQPVMLEQQMLSGEWQCMALMLDGSPKVFDCKHEAFQAVIDVITNAMVGVAYGEIHPSVDLSLEQFRVVPVGPAEPPIKETTAANDCLSKFMKGNV